jgi:predicted nuclease of predicted toxin-antitoxin system
MMKFLVDAHLPRRLIYRLRDAGHDALHTQDLPSGNRTTDGEINAISIREQRAVVTKDADFVHSFTLAHQPYKLLLISTSNIRNAELESRLLAQLPSIAAAFSTHDYLELTRFALIIHA